VYGVGQLHCFSRSEQLSLSPHGSRWVVLRMGTEQGPSGSCWQREHSGIAGRSESNVIGRR
jgi:hypothetical protein